MEREEKLKQTDHYRCRRCGYLSPTTADVCVNPACQAQLALYGDFEFAEVTPPPPPPPGGGGTKVNGGGTTPPPPPPPGGGGTKVNGGGTTPPPPPPGGGGTTVNGGGTTPPPPPPPPERKKVAVAPIVILVLLLLGAIGTAVYMGSEMLYYRDAKERLETTNRKLKSDLQKVEADLQSLDSDYQNLESDYLDLAQEHQNCQVFFENNEVPNLYSVEVTRVYNSDEEGNEIDRNLKIGTMERLGIGVEITAPDETDRWADPLYVKVYYSGNEITKWTIDSSEKYDDDDAVTEWWMWTSTVKNAGVYTVEFIHRDYVVGRYEFTVE